MSNYRVRWSCYAILIWQMCQWLQLSVTLVWKICMYVLPVELATVLWDSIFKQFIFELILQRTIKNDHIKFTFILVLFLLLNCLYESLLRRSKPFTWRKLIKLFIRIYTHTHLSWTHKNPIYRICHEIKGSS